MISTPKISCFFEEHLRFYNGNLFLNEVQINSKYYLLITLNYGVCEEGEIYIKTFKNVIFQKFL